jgi:diguanylate cyclase (GGDEF)-like protein/PAS domain S-box-containing protein
MASPPNQHQNDLLSVKAFMWAVVISGLSAFLYAAAKLPLASLDGRFAVVCLLTIGVGSRIVVDIQLLKSNISVSDIFIILTALLFGWEAAVVLSGVEAFFTSLRFSRQARFRLFNAGVMALSILAATRAVTYWFGSLPQLAQGKLSGYFLAALATMMLVHYVANAGLMAIANALRSRRPWWDVWREYYSWMFVTYLASGAVALITANAINRWSFNAFLLGLPIAGVIYLSYRSYCRQLEVTEEQISQARQHLQEMAESEERFRGAFGEAPIGMALVAPGGEWLQVNRSLCGILGYSEDELLALNCQSLAHQQDVVSLFTMVGKVLQGKEQTQQAELRFYHREGQVVWTATSLSRLNHETGPGQRLIFQIQDITARRKAEEQLRQAAFYDALTGLANRRYFVEQLEDALNHARRDPQYSFAVVFLDFQRIKLVNESIGYAAGDEFLTQVAQRLRNSLPPQHTAARLGNDEFTVLLDGMAQEEDARLFVKRLQKQLVAPFWVGQHEVFAQVNAGVALYRERYDKPEDLLRDADVALQEAKQRGKNAFLVFDQAMHERVIARLQLETDLSYAVERREFFNLYQPILCLETKRLVGFECLVRWQHPQRGLVSPMDFIPLAEETGHIAAIGKFVLEESCRQLRRWQEQFASGLPLTMSVNVSGKQIMQGHLVENVLAVLAETGVTPQFLKLEITESVVLDNLEAATNTLKQLRALGVQLSMDDFGTGYSSLSYLHRLPITTLKIDRSFVTHITERAESAAIARAVILLAKSLQMDIVAEGIETAEQAEALRVMECDYGQGYLFAKPLKVDEAGSLLRDSFNVVPQLTHLLRPDLGDPKPGLPSPQITHAHVIPLNTKKLV